MSATPILDRERPAPKPRRPRWQSIAIGVPLGLALVLARERGALPANRSPLELLAAFVICFYAAIFVHEAGHAITGALAGFEIRGVSVGPFFLAKQARGWGLQFSLGSIFGGGATNLIPRMRENLRGRYILGVLAGPITTTVFIGVCILARGGFWWSVLLVVNVLAGLTTYIPYTVNGQPTDAKIIWILARGGPASEWLLAMLDLLALNARGLQPADWPRDLVETIRKPNAGVYRPAFLAFQCELTADGPLEGAAEALENALAESNKIPPTLRRGFFAAAATFEGFVRQDEKRAREWLDEAAQVRGAVSQKDWDAKARAAILFAQGRISEAGEFLSRYLAMLDRQAVNGMASAERKRAVALRERLSRTVI
jgi:hypothetical protein